MDPQPLQKSHHASVSLALPHGTYSSAGGPLIANYQELNCPVQVSYIIYKREMKSREEKGKELREREEKKNPAEVRKMDISQILYCPVVSSFVINYINCSFTGKSFLTSKINAKPLVNITK